MTIYSFNEHSPVNKIIMRKSAGGGVRAFVHVHQDATGDNVAAITDIIRKQGYYHVATEHEGAPCLEIRGLKKIETLENSLRSANLIIGIRSDNIADEPKVKFGELVKNNMLTVVGILNVVADAGFWIYGRLKNKLDPAGKHWEEQAAAAAYTAGTLTLTAFGQGDKSDHNIKAVALKLQDKLVKDKIIIPPHSALTSFTAKPSKNIGREILDQFQKHPSEIGNGFTGLAGFFIAKGALKIDKEDIKGRRLEGSLGISTLLAGISPTFIKEKTYPKDAPPPKNIFAKVWRWVEERPNRLAGYGYMYSSIAHAWETKNKLQAVKSKYPQEKTKMAYIAYGMRGGFVALNLIAELGMALSSKGHGQGVKTDTSVDDTIYAITADIIGHQPKDKQEALIKDLSKNFLAQPDVIGAKPEETESKLRQRLAKLESNPWIIENFLQTQDKLEAALPTEKFSSQETAKANSIWQNKVITSQTAEPNYAFIA